MNKKNIFKESLDLQIAAKNIGLDWLEIEDIINKMKEETKEVDDAIKQQDSLAIKEELGDLTFTLLCLMRHLNCEPEEIIELANIKFKKRYKQVLGLLQEEGKSYASPEEMEKLWKKIKKQI